MFQAFNRFRMFQNTCKCWTLISVLNVKHLEHLEHLEHLKILNCSSVKHFQVLNRFKMKIIIFSLNHTVTWSKRIKIYFANFTTMKMVNSIRAARNNNYVKSFKLYIISWRYFGLYNIKYIQTVYTLMYSKLLCCLSILLEILLHSILTFPVCSILFDIF